MEDVCKVDIYNAEQSPVIIIINPELDSSHLWANPEDYLCNKEGTRKKNKARNSLSRKRRDRKFIWRWIAYLYTIFTQP